MKKGDRPSPSKSHWNKNEHRRKYGTRLEPARYPDQQLALNADVAIRPFMGITLITQSLLKLNGCVLGATACDMP